MHNKVSTLSYLFFFDTFIQDEATRIMKLADTFSADLFETRMRNSHVSLSFIIIISKIIDTI